MFLSALLVLTPLIALHEWGHYIVARLCGVKVLTYSIGMGPKIFGFVSKKTGIDYRISALPLGGYVKMLDEREGIVADNERHLAFNNAHPLKKIAIVIAGPVMNFLIAIGLFFVVLLQPSEQLNTRLGKVFAPADQVLAVGDKIVAVDDKAVDSWQSVLYALSDRMGETGEVQLKVIKNNDLGKDLPTATVVNVPIANFMQGEDKNKDPLTLIGVATWQPVIPPILDSLDVSGAAQLMGFETGDKIVSIDGTPITTWQDVTTIIRKNPETMLSLTIERAGKTLTLPLMPQAKNQHGMQVGYIGASVVQPKIVVPDDYKTVIKRTPAEAMEASLQRTYDLSVMTIKSMGKMLVGLIGLDNLSGPITIAEVSKHSIEMGLLTVLSTTALISVSLAVLNLLPIPILDGGHIVYALYELIFGKPLSERIQMIGLNMGMLAMLSLMILAVSNDISRLFG